MKAWIYATALTALLAGCATTTTTPPTPTSGPAALKPYVEKPDYDHAMVCDISKDDLQKCEAVIKQLCGARGFVDLRIRPLREPGTESASSTMRLLQLQCKPSA